MRFKLQYFYSLLIMSCLMLSCNNQFDVDLKEDIVLKAYRFDQDLMQETPITSSFVDSLKQKYSAFIEPYSIGVLKIGSSKDEQYPLYLSQFRENPLTQRVHREVEKQIASTEAVTKDISRALSYYHYYFPNYPIPTIYYMQSGFNQRVVVDSLMIAIGLDMALGEDNPYYDSLSVARYMRKQLTVQNLKYDVIRGIAWSEFPFSGENLAETMIYEGKVQYILNACFPHSELYAQFSYTEEQWQWLEQYEEEIWQTIIEQELLYETNYMKIRGMTGVAPFTNTFGQNSPPRIGIWVGWRIVQSYMEHHPETSLQNLMKMDNIQLLNSSEYKP